MSKGMESGNMARPSEQQKTDLSLEGVETPKETPRQSTASELLALLRNGGSLTPQNPEHKRREGIDYIAGTSIDYGSK